MDNLDIEDNDHLKLFELIHELKNLNDIKLEQFKPYESSNIYIKHNIKIEQDGKKTKYIFTFDSRYLSRENFRTDQLNIMNSIRLRNRNVVCWDYENEIIVNYSNEYKRYSMLVKAYKYYNSITEKHLALHRIINLLKTENVPRLFLEHLGLMSKKSFLENKKVCFNASFPMFYLDDLKLYPDEFNNVVFNFKNNDIEINVNYIKSFYSSVENLSRLISSFNNQISLNTKYKLLYEILDHLKFLNISPSYDILDKFLDTSCSKLFQVTRNMNSIEIVFDISFLTNHPNRNNLMTRILDSYQFEDHKIILPKGNYIIIKYTDIYKEFIEGIEYFNESNTYLYEHWGLCGILDDIDKYGREEHYVKNILLALHLIKDEDLNKKELELNVCFSKECRNELKKYDNLKRYYYEGMASFKFSINSNFAIFVKYDK